MAAQSATEGRNVAKIVTIYLEPIPKARPRFHLVRGHVHTYTPAKTANYEKRIAEAWSEQAGFTFDKDIPLAVHIYFGMPIPKSTTKKNKSLMLEGLLKHTKKPDIDNLIKSVLDGLNGVAWEDDAQIVRISAEKYYSLYPSVTIYIAERED